VSGKKESRARENGEMGMWWYVQRKKFKTEWIARVECECVQGEVEPGIDWSRGKVGERCRRVGGIPIRERELRNI
jgi:hypothetical protein